MEVECPCCSNNLFDLSTSQGPTPTWIVSQSLFLTTWMLYDLSLKVAIEFIFLIWLSSSLCPRPTIRKTANQKATTKEPPTERSFSLTTMIRWSSNPNMNCQSRSVLIAPMPDPSLHPWWKVSARRIRVLTEVEKPLTSLEKLSEMVVQKSSPMPLSRTFQAKTVEVSMESSPKEFAPVL